MKLSRDILRGITDLHIHAGPSVANRSVDAVEAYNEAAEAGYRAVLVKDHYFPSTMGTTMINKHLGNGYTECFSWLVLNNAVGAFNLIAVDTAVKMGAKIICMPTISAKNHIDTHKHGFVGAGSNGLTEKPIYYLDENDELIPEVTALLEYLAQHKDICLATGHACAHETDKLIRKAADLGIEKILVNHPFFDIDATIEDVKRWASLGAMIEINVCVFENMINLKTGKIMGPIPFSLFKEYYDNLPIENIVIDTDLGQSIFVHPVEGMYEFLNEIHDRYGITEEEINIMTKKNPAKLIGIQE